MIRLINYLFLLIIFFSCNKENNDTKFKISHLSTEPTQITEFQENINVRISYEHPEGFLGFYDPDYLSLEIKDSRLTNSDFYHLEPINLPNEIVSIVGEILIEVDAPFIFGNGNSETLSYSIRIQDQSGNWSNSINSSSITVSR